MVRTGTFGVALRTGASDAGLSIGYTRTTLVLENAPDLPPAGSHLFGVALSGRPAIATIRHVFGVDIDMNRHQTGVSVGFSEDAIFADVASDTSTLRHLELSLDDPSSMVLRTCTGAAACE